MGMQDQQQVALWHGCSSRIQFGLAEGAFLRRPIALAAMPVLAPPGPKFLATL
jgi:hypothetical protein